jgi:hypothetical protein
MKYGFVCVTVTTGSPKKKKKSCQFLIEREFKPYLWGAIVGMDLIDKSTKFEPASNIILGEIKKKHKKTGGLKND